MALPSASITLPAPPPATLDDCDDETRSVDDDDEVGSLVDFVVEDEEEVPSAKPAADPLDGMDMTNVLLGKRKRKQTVFY